MHILKNNIDDNLLNIGSGHEVSIKELVDKVVELTNYKGVVEYTSCQMEIQKN